METGTLSARLAELQECVDRGQITADRHDKLQQRLFDEFVSPPAADPLRVLAAASGPRHEPRFAPEVPGGGGAPGAPSRGRTEEEIRVPPVRRNSRRSGSLATLPQVSQADFWCKWIERASYVGKSYMGIQEMQLDQTAVSNICDVTIGRLEEIFAPIDKDQDGFIDGEELEGALLKQGLEVGSDGAQEIMRRITEGQTDRAVPVGKVSFAEFNLILKLLRLAELFTPSAGIFQWSSERSSSSCPITVCDYCAADCSDFRTLEGDAARREFFFGRPLKKSARSTRWIHVDATKRLDRLTMLRLGVKYHLHPLAIEDVFDSRTATKLDEYPDTYFFSLEILMLAKDQPGPPARVRFSRSNVSMFLAGPPCSDWLLTIHQERTDESSWLCMWRGETCRSDVAPCRDIWEGLRRELQRRPIRRVRQESADFLAMEVLHCVAVELRPIADAYATWLGYMHQQPINQFKHSWRCDLDEIQLELKDLARSMRPLRHLVRRFIDDDQVGSSAAMYLHAVEDQIVNMVEDVTQLSQMAQSLMDCHQQYRDNRMNDTLFALSIVSAVFLPAQFFTGLYGMNFQDPEGNPSMPELLWTHGYHFFWVLEVLSVLCSIAGIAAIGGIPVGGLPDVKRRLGSAARCCRRWCTCQGRHGRQVRTAAEEAAPR